MMRVSLVKLLALSYLFTALSALLADDDPRPMRYVTIQDSRGAYLVHSNDETKFRKEEVRGAEWHLEFTKDGLLIRKEKSKHLLGIDPKTKQLTLGGEPGATTLWQLKPAGAYEIRPPRPFKALLLMKIADEELRLSNEGGTPKLGGKADILLFSIDGA